MISGKIFVCLVILATANYLMAEDSPSENEGPPHGDRGHHRPPPFSSFDFSDILGGGKRENEGSNPDNEDAGPGPQSRFFFSSFFNTRLVACNYTTQAGATCSNCRQVLRCFSGDAGTLTTCRGIFPYCNNGRCSLYAENNCTALG